MGAEKIIFIVAPGGAVGGGMGRVKDYILQSGGDRAGRYRFEALVTRDERGAFHSLLLLAKAMLAVFLARIGGNLAFVHVNFGDKGSAFRKGLLILFAKAIGARVLLHLHAAELTEFYASSPGWRRAALRWPFEAADCVVVLGRLWRDWLVQELGLPAGKIDILYNGVPADPAPRRFAAGESGPRRILFLGFLTERKGISDFLAALAGMPPDAAPWEAIVAGNGEVEFYRARAASLGIAGRTRFLGWVGQSEVRDWLRTVDLMVLPSYNEGLPLVILEALGCGAPVLTTPIGAIPEVLRDGENVLFVAPGDRAGLAAAMARAIGDPRLLQHLSDNGLARFRERFTLEAFRNDLFAIYSRRFGASVEPVHPVAQPEPAE